MRPALKIALGAGLVLVLGALYVFGVTGGRPENTAPLRVHRADVVGWDGTVPALIRCPVCDGRGQARRYGHTGDGTDPRNYYPEGWVTCPACNGLGRQTVRGKPVEVIPDGMPLE